MPPPQDEIQTLLNLYQQKQLPKVVEGSTRLLARHPESITALNLLGAACLSLRKFEQAADAFRRVLAIKPDAAEAHGNLGNVFKEEGRLDEAIAAYQRALAINPEYLSAHIHLGNALREQGMLDEAVASLVRALAIKPDHFGAYNNLGAILKEQGRLEQAATALGRAAAIRPDYAPAHFNLGVVLREQGKLDDATAAIERAVAIDPRWAEAHNSLADLFLKQEKLDEAVASLSSALTIEPDHFGAHANLGIVLKRQGRLDEAALSLGRALAVRPDFAEAHGTLGLVLQQQGRLDEAVASYQRAIAIKPGFVEAHLNLGNAYKDQGRFDEAATCFGHVLTIDPGSTDAQANIALLHLLRGDFATGWRSYEWRKRATKAAGSREFQQPAWLGGDLGGKAIFLHHEQGLGDTIQFIRYAPLVRDLGARVTVSVQQALLPLLASSFPDIEIIGGDATPARFDHHASLLSLPLAFDTRLETIPAPLPYLRADPERVAKWTERLGSRGFKIGICWQGKAGEVDHGRSFSVTEFRNIARLPDVRLVSLHKGAGDKELDSLRNSLPIERLGADFDPPGSAFLDSLAVMQWCDLVITSDTSVAHVAGASGVPTWLVLKDVPDWRWMLGRNDSPWYPGMRLFRQKRRGDWQSVFAEIEQALMDRIDGRR